MDKADQIAERIWQSLFIMYNPATGQQGVFSNHIPGQVKETIANVINEEIKDL